MSQAYILLIGILVLSIIGHNMTVTYAVCAVLVLKVLGLTQAMEIINKQGINWGIIILTTAILIPIANGKITVQDIALGFKSEIGIVCVLVGVMVAIAGHNGIELLKVTPEVVSCLIIGTMIGVFFFRGIAVGPLIAGGIAYWILGILKILHLG